MERALCLLRRAVYPDEKLRGTYPYPSACDNRPPGPLRILVMENRFLALGGEGRGVGDYPFAYGSLGFR